jgi:hypothetical protein
MADYTSVTVTGGHETAEHRNAKDPERSHDGLFGEVVGRRLGEMVVTRQSAADIVIRTDLSRADQDQILALPYPVEHQAFWQMLADLGVTQERLMDRLGAGP